MLPVELKLSPQFRTRAFLQPSPRARFRYDEYNSVLSETREILEGNFFTRIFFFTNCFVCVSSFVAEPQDIFLLQAFLLLLTQSVTNLQIISNIFKRLML